jgi:hypothetical protein
MRNGWRPPLWFDKPIGRILFLRELAEIPSTQQVKSGAYPGGFSVSLTLNPQGVPPRHVTITFSRRSPMTPRVLVDGPTDSPHRYPDDTLCMWYPEDPPERRWILDDGAAALIANVTAHLVREEWYRNTGEWIGEEVGHGPGDPLNDPEKAEINA